MVDGGGSTLIAVHSSEAMAPLLSVRDLVFRWSRRSPVCLDIPALDFYAGERVFLQGPSGTGKTTLLNVLGGVCVPQQGCVMWQGEDITTWRAHRRDALRADAMGFIFQQFNLLPWLSAWDNVMLTGAFSKQRAQRVGHAKEEAARLLTQLDLSPDLWKRSAGLLSVGQQQRVAAARALMGRPQLVIADEPVSALDAVRQQLFIDLLHQEVKASGALLIFVSHDERLASSFDRQVALNLINRAMPQEAAA